MRECFRGLIDLSDCPITKFMPFFCALLKENGITEIKYMQVASERREETRIYFEAFAEEEYIYLADENFAKLITTWWKNSSRTIQFGEDFLFKVNYIGKCSGENKLHSTFCQFWINNTVYNPTIGYNTINSKSIKTVAEWNKTWGKYHLSLVQRNNLQK